MKWKFVDVKLKRELKLLKREALAALEKKKNIEWAQAFRADGVKPDGKENITEGW